MDVMLTTSFGVALLVAAWLMHRSERRRARRNLDAFYREYFDDYLEDYERELAMAEFTAADLDDDIPDGWPRFYGPVHRAPRGPDAPRHAFGQPEQHRVTLGEAQARCRRLLKEWRERNAI